VIINNTEGLAIPLQYESPFCVVGLSLSDMPNVRPCLDPEIENE